MQTSHKFTKTFISGLSSQFVSRPKLYFTTPNGVATHSLRSPGLDYSFPTFFEVGTLL